MHLSFRLCSAEFIANEQACILMGVGGENMKKINN